MTKIRYSESNTSSLIETPLNMDADMIVIIPSFAEKDILGVLDSLNNCDREGVVFEVILLINESEEVDPEHQKINRVTYTEAIAYKASVDWTLHVLYISDIPAKIAGVGTARKLAMDEAATHLNEIDKSRSGIIVNLDADCRVSMNYFQEIKAHFNSFAKDELVSIAFAHRMDEISDPLQKNAISQYEKYLHYFIGMQRDLGLPYAYQTIGSAFAVRASAYRQVGGMNRRKAGEDFYFIHKFTKKGTIAELNSCTVYPSGRSSFRVPFGTGKAVSDMLGSESIYYAYHPQSFFDLRPLIEGVAGMYVDNSPGDLLDGLPKSVKEYLETQNFNIQMSKLIANSRKIETFEKAFYQWFDAFRLMKYLHFVRESYFPDLPVVEAMRLRDELLREDEI